MGVAQDRRRRLDLSAAYYTIIDAVVTVTGGEGNYDFTHNGSIASLDFLDVGGLAYQWVIYDNNPGIENHRVAASTAAVTGDLLHECCRNFCYGKNRLRVTGTDGTYKVRIAAWVFSRKPYGG